MVTNPSEFDQYNMSDYSEYCDLLQLTELLNPKKDDNSDSEDDIDNTTIQGSGDTNKTCQVSSNTYKECEKDETRSREVVDPDEEAAFLFENETAEASDWRKCPEWDISYRQQVTPSDMFLQMGGKTPSTSSCEDMIVQVHLPGESRQNIDLKITCQRLDLTSPQFRLGIPLPHPVDPQKGNAQWDADTSKLKINLRMRREFDYVNF